MRRNTVPMFAKMNIYYLSKFLVNSKLKSTIKQQTNKHADRQNETVTEQQGIFW